MLQFCYSWNLWDVATYKTVINKSIISQNTLLQTFYQCIYYQCWTWYVSYMLLTVNFKTLSFTNVFLQTYSSSFLYFYNLSVTKNWISRIFMAKSCVGIMFQFFIMLSFYICSSSVYSSFYSYSKIIVWFNSSLCFFLSRLYVVCNSLL